MLASKGAAAPQQTVRQRAPENRKVQTTAPPVQPSATPSVPEAVGTRVDESLPQDEGTSPALCIDDLFDLDQKFFISIGKWAFEHHLNKSLSPRWKAG